MKRTVSCKLLLYTAMVWLSWSVRGLWEDIESSLSHELEGIRNRLTDNKLSLHLGKTDSILFGSPKQIKKRSAIKISRGDTSITAKSTVGYLGSK